MAQVKKKLPRFETEGAVVWSADGFNKQGYKSVLVKTQMPQFLDKKFSGEDLELVKKAFEPREGYEEPGAFMAIHNKWTKGHEQEVLHSDCYIEYTIRVAPGKKDPSIKYVNMLIKKIEVLQKEEEDAA